MILLMNHDLPRVDITKLKMSPADKAVYIRNEIQRKELAELKARETWYAGEDLGYDPTTTPDGCRLIREREVAAILKGFGRFLADKLNLVQPEQCEVQALYEVPGKKLNKI